MRTVIVFGNPDLRNDSLPLRILPELKKRVPDTSFLVLDPNEEWPDIDDFTVIDTVQGIQGVMVFSNLKQFASAPRVSMHDFDALSYLRYLEKLGKIKRVTVIGVPPAYDEPRATSGIAALLKPNRPSKSALRSSCTGHRPG